MNRYLSLAVLAGTSLLFGCVTNETRDGAPVSSSSGRANAAADQTMYRPVEYANRRTRGPVVVVLPGEIKSNNATFLQKVTANNIADFGELELGRDNFRVLERTDLGPMLNEISLAVNMGDPQALRRFRRGKFKSTQWFVKFDILKAEPVSRAGSGFSGATIGSMLGRATGNSYLGQGLSSVNTSEEAGVWVIGLRYKLMDARTSEQVATNYFERKMQVGATSTSVMGISQSQEGGVTLDSMVQRLVQEAVRDMDTMKEGSSSSRGSNVRGDMGVAFAQQALNAAGYDAGPADGLMGERTRSALRAFQADHGLDVTGRLDSATERALGGRH